MITIHVGCRSVILLRPKIGSGTPKTWRHKHANTAIYQYKLHIIRKVSSCSCSFHYAEIYGPNQNIQWQFELPWSENQQKFLGWLTVLCSQMRQVFINIPTISGVSKWSVFPSLENLERTWGSAEQILRNRRHRAKNRISTLYRMTA